jgi:type II secretory pathway pseudopilin PulG
MITVVIVGILASVAIPIYQANVNRAKAAEADAALGTVRTALRVFYAENGSYPTSVSYTEVTTLNLGVDSADLTGTYFMPADYTYQSTDGTTYTIRATGSGPQIGINRQMTSAGVLSNF